MGKQNKQATKAPTTPATPVASATLTPTTAPAATQATNPALAQAYTLGKAYNVRPNTAADNAATWALLTACVQANGGTATRAQLQAAAATRNHVNMVGYCIRRQWLVPATVVPATSAPVANATAS